MNRQEAIIGLVQEILADEERTMRVVVAAVIAQNQIDRNHPAFDTLGRGLATATCAYCGGDCPNDATGDHLCDGYAGDIDNLYNLYPVK